MTQVFQEPTSEKNKEKFDRSKRSKQRKKFSGLCFLCLLLFTEGFDGLAIVAQSEFRFLPSNLRPKIKCGGNKRGILEVLDHD